MKKALEKKKATRNVEESYSRLRAITEAVDDTEGEIAAKEVALQRLKAALVAKEKALGNEKRALSLLELEMDRFGRQRADFEAYLAERRGGGVVAECNTNKRVCAVQTPMEEEEEEDHLSAGFSGVCV